MVVSVASLGIDQLTVAERLELIEQIWDSLPEQVEPGDIPEWHLAELARRRADVEVNPGVGKPWREVLDRLEGGS
jgi:putative addiction module component (TIGR02574 family)